MCYLKLIWNTIVLKIHFNIYLAMLRHHCVSEMTFELLRRTLQIHFPKYYNVGTNIINVHINYIGVITLHKFLGFSILDSHTFHKESDFVYLE